MEQEGARDREESARFREDMARDREETKRQAARQRLAREVFDCGEPQYFGTLVSPSRDGDRSRRRELDALYVGTRAVLFNETRSSPRMSDAQAFARFLESGEFARHAGAQGFVHPALDGEVRDAGKLVDVAGYQRRPQRPGMSGDQKVIVADRATDPLQFGAYVAVVSVGRLLHREDVLRPHRRIGDFRSCGRISASVRFLFTGSTTRRSSSLWRMTRSGRRWRLIVRNSWGPRWGDGGFAYASDAYAASAWAPRRCVTRCLRRRWLIPQVGSVVVEEVSSRCLSARSAAWSIPVADSMSGHDARLRYGYAGPILW